jgi:hypothetical protein
MLAAATSAARDGLLTLGQIAERVEAAHGELLPCRMKTLAVAPKREGFSFKRNRYSSKNRNDEEFALKAATLEKHAARDGQFLPL